MVDYKHEHDIVETDAGRLVDDQRLTGMNDKLNAAHDETLKAKARFDQFSAARGMEVPSAAASGSDADSAPYPIFWTNCAASILMSFPKRRNLQ